MLPNQLIADVLAFGRVKCRSFPIFRLPRGEPARLSADLV